MDLRLPGELTLFRLVNAGGPPWMDWAFEALSSRSFCLALAALASLFLIAKFRRDGIRAVVAAWLALGISDGIGHWILKPLIHRPRPCQVLEPGTFRQLLPAGDWGAMPSLHAANALAFALIVALRWPALGAFVLPLALLIGISRIYVGVHWPSDVLGGFLWGAAVSLCVWALWGRSHRSVGEPRSDADVVLHRSSGAGHS